MTTIPRVLTVLIEYSPTQQRIMVRGAWEQGKGPANIAPLAPENTQNFVKVFEGVDMKSNVGFAGLVPVE